MTSSLRSGFERKQMTTFRIKPLPTAKEPQQNLSFYVFAEEHRIFKKKCQELDLSQRHVFCSLITWFNENELKDENFDNQLIGGSR